MTIETSDLTALWWISFLVDDSFNGACVVAGHDLIAAIQRAQFLGICPGGEIMASIIPENCREDFEPHKDKFLDKTEAESIFDNHELPKDSFKNIMWN